MTTTTAKPSASAFIRNLHANLGDQRFLGIGWNNPELDAIIRKKGLVPADVRAEAREMADSIAACNEAH